MYQPQKHKDIIAIINRPKGRNWEQHNHQEEFNTPVLPMDRSSRQKTNKETQGLNDTSD